MDKDKIIINLIISAVVILFAGYIGSSIYEDVEYSKFCVDKGYDDYYIYNLLYDVDYPRTGYVMCVNYGNISENTGRREVTYYEVKYEK